MIVGTVVAVCDEYVIVAVMGDYACEFFFFQAEDGIRDLVRSRGLGDVYKRQLMFCLVSRLSGGGSRLSFRPCCRLWDIPLIPIIPVSYTHLTLPTSDLV